MIVTGAAAAPAATTLDGIATLLSAIIWPLVILLILLTQRKPLARLITALVSLAESANKIKIWQVEIDRDIDKVVDQSGASGEMTTSKGVPAGEVAAAQQVGLLVSRVSDSAVRANLLDSQKQKMLQLAQEYETTRANMMPGPDRTRMMDAVMAKMRALALAVKSSLDEFAADDASPGKRLAAIAVLQIAPELSYTNWLVDRMAVEQPFVFFHASVALLAFVRAFGHSHREELEAAVNASLKILHEVTGRSPDRDTVATLNIAQHELVTSETQPEMAN